MTTSSGKFVEIEVAKEKLDIAVSGEKKANQVTNDENRIGSLYAKVLDHSKCHDARSTAVVPMRCCLLILLHDLRKTNNRPDIQDRCCTLC